jgi:hypothetical protein
MVQPFQIGRRDHLIANNLRPVASFFLMLAATWLEALLLRAFC